MKETIKQQWIQALRSKEYTQAQGNLRSTEGFCCLGVLCDVYSKETGDEWDVMHTPYKTPIAYYEMKNHSSVPPECVYEMKNHSSVPPECVLEWSGLDDKNPSVKLPEEDEELSLAYLNDVGKTFEEIADLIEAQL